MGTLQRNSFCRVTQNGSALIFFYILGFLVICPLRKKGKKKKETLTLLKKKKENQFENYYPR